MCRASYILYYNFYTVLDRLIPVLDFFACGTGVGDRARLATVGFFFTLDKQDEINNCS